MFSTLVKPFQTTIDMKFVPYMKQYVWRFLIKFQPNPTVGLRYIIDTVKLDNQCLLRVGVTSLQQYKTFKRKQILNNNNNGN